MSVFSCCYIHTDVDNRSKEKNNGKFHLQIACKQFLKHTHTVDVKHSAQYTPQMKIHTHTEQILRKNIHL